jgi:hypothetical protein
MSISIFRRDISNIVKGESPTPRDLTTMKGWREMKKEKKGKGGRKMELRKVLKIRNSLYVCLPSETCELWGIEKGDYLTCLYLPGYGVLMTRGMELDKLPFQEARVVKMKQITDNLFSELRKKARGVERSFVGNLYLHLIRQAQKDGVIKFNPKVKHYVESARLSGKVAAEIPLAYEIEQIKGLLEDHIKKEEGRKE